MYLAGNMHGLHCCTWV